MMRPLLCLAAGAALLFTAGCRPQVILLDARTGDIVGERKVRLYSDNGIRCVTTPCPTDGRFWEGASDFRGHLEIPEDMIDVSMHLEVEGYRSVALPERSEWPRPLSVKLSPERTAPKPPRPHNALIGRWRTKGGVLVRFNPNGRFWLQDGPGESELSEGTWTPEDDGSYRVEFERGKRSGSARVRKQGAQLTLQNASGEEVFRRP